MTYDVQTPGVARLWAYGPDWSRGVELRRAFQTDIAKSRDQTEQRRALRFTPRRSTRYRTVVTGNDRREAERFLHVWQNKPTVVPDFTRWARLTATSSSGASTLTISPMPAWIAEAQTLVLCGTGGDHEQLLVASVAGTTATLEDPLAATWASGSVIRPTLFGLLSGEMNSTRPNRDSAAIDVQLSAYAGGEASRAEGSPWASFDSREVFTLMPDYASPPSIDYLWPVEQIDYGRGRTAQFRPVTRFARGLELDFNGQDATAAGEIEQFFDRHFGRRNAFYMPTWEPDLVLGANATSGTSTLRVDGDLTEYDAFDAIAVCLTDGTQLYRTLSAPSLVSGDTQFTVSSSWPVTLTSSNVARICWMPLVRFSADELATMWRTPLSANVRLAVQQVSG